MGRGGSRIGCGMTIPSLDLAVFRPFGTRAQRDILSNHSVRGLP